MPREPSAVGRLILERLASLSRTQAELARVLDLDRRFLWEIIWGTRGCPTDRLGDLAAALCFEGNAADVLIIAHTADRLRRIADRAASPSLRRDRQARLS